MLHLHSILRWAVLIFLLFSVIKSVSSLIGKKEYTADDAKTALLLMIFTHLQLLIGIVLYFTQGWAEAPFGESMKVAEARFWKVEHLTAMLIVVFLITLGRMKSKKQVGVQKGHRTILIYFGISLLIILWAIPWQADRLF